MNCKDSVTLSGRYRHMMKKTVLSDLPSNVTMVNSFFFILITHQMPLSFSLDLSLVVYHLVFLFSLSCVLSWQNNLPKCSSQTSNDSRCYLGCHWAVSCIWPSFPQCHNKLWQRLWYFLPFLRRMAIYSVDPISCQYIVNIFLYMVWSREHRVH